MISNISIGTTNTTTLYREEGERKIERKREKDRNDYSVRRRGK